MPLTTLEPSSREVHELLQTACLELGYPVEEARPLADWITAEHWVTTVAQLENLTDVQWSRLNLPVALEATVQRIIAERSSGQGYGYAKPWPQPQLQQVATSQDVQMNGKSFATFNVRGRRFRIYRELVAKHAAGYHHLATILAENGSGPLSQRPIDVDADPDLFRFVILWYTHGSPVRVPSDVDVRKLRGEFEALGIHLGERDIISQDDQRPLELSVIDENGNESFSWERIGGPREGSALPAMCHSAVKPVASYLGHNPDQAQRLERQPLTLRLHAIAPPPDSTPPDQPQTLRPCEWRVEHENITGVVEAGLTAQFDWREVHREPYFQQALRRHGLESGFCEMLGDSERVGSTSFALGIKSL